MKEPVRQEWVSHPEAERYSGLSRTAIGRCIKRGEIQAARVGGSVRISRQSLEEFMKTRVTQPRLPGFDDFE
jgi:excisionase family DNA binding protein